MKNKIITPAGNMYLSDSRMIKHAIASFNGISNYNVIDIRNLTKKENKSYYKIETPFGCSFVRSYGDVFNIRSYYNRNQTKKDIEILTTH